MKRLLVLSLVLSLRFASAASDTAPDWVLEASTRAIPNYGNQVSYVTLFHEGHAALDPDGTLHQTLHYAIRILNVEGRKEAVASVPYLKGATKLRELRAWLIGPDGSVKTYGKESVLDVNVRENFELYSEFRERLIKASNPPDGSTFAWSATYDESLWTLSDHWKFQQRQPVLLSRYSVTLPAGWKAQGVVFNADSIKPVQDGSTYSWEAHDLKSIKREPCSPASTSLAPWLGVSFLPPAGVAAHNAFGSWKDVSNFQTDLASKQADTNEVMAAKVRELTYSSTSNYAKVVTLGNYVQRIRYVEIATNLARGGGYVPHLASEVFAKQYGDCKDKANLLRALLQQAGLRSYLVAIYSGDRYYVHPNGPRCTSLIT